MMLPVFVVGEGEVYVTPEDSGLSTLTLNFSDRYTKLRHVDVNVCYSKLATARGLFPEDSWFCVGQPPQRLFMRTKSLYKAIDRLQDRKTKGRVHEAVCHFFGLPYAADLPTRSEKEEISALQTVPEGQRLPVSRPCRDEELVRWLEHCYKITTAMCPALRPVVVASKKFYEGESKVHKKIVVLHSPCREDAPLIGRMFVLTKPTSEHAEEDLVFDFTMSRMFAALHVSNTITFTPVHRGIGMRPCGDPKFGLLSEYFEGGNLRNYMECHFDPSRPMVLPMHRNSHLVLAFQVAQALSEVHTSNVIHGDLRLENVLVRLTRGGPVAVLSDFCLVEKIGSVVHGPLGSYPPPESLAKRKAQQGGLDEEVWEDMTVSPSVDSWSFGLVLFLLCHGFSFDVDGVHYRHSLETVLEDRKHLLTLLAPEGTDGVDDLIRSLLHLDPEQRPLAYQAALALERQIDVYLL
jgi:serine/threonine protein kinase